MSGLRWVLLGLGVLLIIGLYVFGRGLLRRPSAGTTFRSRRMEPDELSGPDEPALDTASPPASAAEPAFGPATEVPTVEDETAIAGEPVPETERVVTLRLVSKDESWNGQTVVLALRAAGLKHGRYGIFHRLPESDAGEPLFSVANLTEPGSFDLTNLSETTLPGVSLFLVLPGSGDPVERFDLMVAAARELALELDGELHDDRGSTWSIQRERYVREQIIQYHYQLERS